MTDPNALPNDSFLAVVLDKEGNAVAKEAPAIVIHDDGKFVYPSDPKLNVDPRDYEYTLIPITDIINTIKKGNTPIRYFQKA